MLSGLIKSDGKTKIEQFFELVSLVGENPAGRHEAWRFVRRYFDIIVGK